ncbi:hypothetical protein D3C81_1868630 [compost metagenome]
MHVVHRRAIACGSFRSERRVVELASGGQVTVVVTVRLCSHGGHGGLQAQFAQDQAAIAGDLNACTNLRQFSRLLQNHGIYAMLPQRDCRAQTTDTSPHNNDSHAR